MVGVLVPGVVLCVEIDTGWDVALRLGQQPLPGSMGLLQECKYLGAFEFKTALHSLSLAQLSGGATCGRSTVCID